jgi:uncharacterized protein
MLDEETGRKAIDFLLETSGGRITSHRLFRRRTAAQLAGGLIADRLLRKSSRETGKAIRLTITTNATRSTTPDRVYQRTLQDRVPASTASEVHNRMRPDAGGHGTYDRVARHIRSFVAARGDREYYLRATFTRHNLDFDQDVLHLAGLGSQLSVEPVVAPDGSGYEIRAEDLPAIEQAYERLAQAMLDAEERGEGFNFFHFMVDLSQGPCFYKRLKGLRRRNRILRGHAGRRHLSLPPVCRHRVVQDGQRP